VAIVGGSGSGKTTLLNLVLTWMRPMGGAITFQGDTRRGRGDRLTLSAAHQRDGATDGQGLPAGDDSTLASERRARGAMSIVCQEVVLFHGTVEQNIAYCADGATRQDVEWAAGCADCAAFIQSLPAQYNTVVGGGRDCTLALSGGEAQRIAVARAICRRPALLLLDEVKASLELTCTPN